MVVLLLLLLSSSSSSPVKSIVDVSIAIGDSPDSVSSLYTMFLGFVIEVVVDDDDDIVDDNEVDDFDF